MSTSNDPTAGLARKVGDAEKAYQAADAERRRVFAIAYDTGAMTYKQVGDAAGLSPHTVRSLIEGMSDREARKQRAAGAALSLLDGDKTDEGEG